MPALTQTLLALGQYDRAPDQQALTERIGIFLHKYESMPMADMDMGVLCGRVRADPERIRRVSCPPRADDARAQLARHSGHAHERVAGRERHRDRGGVRQEHRPEPRTH
ncbi:MAG: hypothetical protein ACLSHG_07170 [Oscillospiraceae bacterium]